MLRRRLLLAVLALAVCAPAGFARVTTAHAAATLSPLWSHTYAAAALNAGTPWGTQPYAGTAAGDLSGDGRMEVVTAFPDGKVWAYDSNGNVLAGWPQQTGGQVYGTPAIADLYGDGHQEVIAASEDGKVYVWDANGDLEPGWPQCGCYGAFQKFFIGGAVVGDLFGNGEKEIVAAGSYYVFAWNTHGQLLNGFPVFMWDTDVATPTLVDLDHNGLLWIIEGGDSFPGGGHAGAWYAIPPYGCPSPNATRSGCDHAGWPITVDDTPWSSPAGVNAFETDGGGYRIYSGTGHFYHQAYGCGTCGDRIDAWNSDGSWVSGWPVATGAPNFGSVAVGDLGLNNTMEQVAEQSEDLHTHVLNADGSALSGFNSSSSVDLGSAAIGPVSNTAGNGVWVGVTGNVLGYDKTGTLQDTAPTPSGSIPYAAPTIADLGIGPELFVTSGSGSSGTFNTWSVTAYAIPSPGSGGNISRSWPTFHGNMERNGGQVPVAAITSPANLSTAATSDFDVNWALANGSLPATSYVLWSRDVTSSDVWRIYTRTNAQSAHFYGTAGHRYAFYVDAQSALGSANLPKAGAYLDTATAGAAALHGSTYTAMTPYRIVDTRAQYCVQCGTGGLSAYETRTISVASYAPPGYGGPTVPNTATAVVLNVTAVSPTNGTYLSVFPAGTPRPNASSLNAPIYGQIANLVTVALGSGGDVEIFNNDANVDLVVDVEGYYSNSGSTIGEYHSLAAPVRACDTRSGHGTACNNGTADNALGPGSVRAITVTGGITGIPADGTAAAVVMNLTGIADYLDTWLTVFPPDPVSHACGAPPTASNLNLPRYTSQPNRVIVRVDSTTGQVCIFNANGSINLAVDVNGWFGNGAESSLASGTTFHPMSPQRFCDTRIGQGTTCTGASIGYWGTDAVTASGQGGLPGWGMRSLVVNATLVTDSGCYDTYVSLYADGAAYPGTSDLNSSCVLDVVANMVMVTIPSDGRIDVTNAAGAIDFITDAVGWFS